MMNEVDLDRLRHQWNRIQQLSMLNEILRTLVTSLKLEESELRATMQEQHQEQYHHQQQNVDSDQSIQS